MGGGTLNGAQIQSLIEIVKAVADGSIPFESGVEILMAGFGYTREEAVKILADADGSNDPAEGVKIDEKVLAV